MTRIDFVTGNARRYLPDIEALASVPDRVESLLAHRSSAELRLPPRDNEAQQERVEEWSPARTIGHLISSTRHQHERIHNMIWLTDPRFIVYDEEAEARQEGWESLDGALLLDKLSDSIAGIVNMLNDLPDASWGRAGIHPTLGRRSIRQQVQMALEHYEEHLNQIGQALKS